VEAWPRPNLKIRACCHGANIEAVPYQFHRFPQFQGLCCYDDTLTTLDFRRADFGSSGTCLVEYHGTRTKPWREVGPRKLVNAQGSPPPSSGWWIPTKRKSGKNGMVYMDEQVAPEQTRTQKGSLQRVEARTGSLGGIQRNCLNSQASG